MENNNVDFLLKEYEECYKQIRFYDERMERLIKYLFMVSYASLIGIYYIFKSNNINYSNFNTFNNNVLMILVLISVFDFLFSVFVLLSLIKNRIYFVIVAKQMNSIRNYFISKIEDFSNQMYISTNIEIFKFTSIHSLKLFGVFLFTIFYFIIFTASVYYLNNQKIDITKLTFYTSFFVLINFYLFYFYTKSLQDKSADKIVHGEDIC